MRTYRRLQTQGLTLLELLIVMAMTAILASAIAFAYTGLVDMQRLTAARRAQVNSTGSMEQQVTNLLQCAYLSATATDTTCFFQGVQDQGSATLGCDRVTFTTTAPGIPMSSLYSTDDFMTQQTNNGPVGGVAEVSLSTTAVGDSGSRAGLFERIQQPSDSDPTQGGMEFVLDPDIDTIGFQFWDGLEWTSVWDTTTGQRLLPQAVQVNYTLKGDKSDTVHQFIVPLLTSTVSPNNPDTNESSTTSAGAAPGGAPGGAAP